MLEPWIIEQIRRREEEERRQRDRSQLELPVEPWPDHEADDISPLLEPPDAPKRGVVIISM